MATSWNGPALTDLNYYMKNRASGVIVPDLYEWGTLDDYMKGSLRKDAFYGDLVEALIQTSHAHTGQGFGENIDIPYPDDFGFVKMWVPLKETIVNAGITRQALRRATGGNASWGPVLEHVLREQKRDWMWLRELCAFGDGTGRLARVSAASLSGTTLTITCDNTYADFGCENVALIKKGMWIELYNNAGLQIGDVATTGVPTSSTTNAWEVTSVTFGDRNNSTATTGTFTIEVTNDITGTTRAVADGSLICIANSASLSLSETAGAGSGVSTCYQLTDFCGGSGTANLSCNMPMGLLGLVQDSTSGRNYTDGTYDFTIDTFQGLARASYATLRARVIQGADFGGTDGTPSDWTLADIDDQIEAVYQDTGKKSNLMVCSGQLARAIDRRNRAENSITTTTATATGQRQNVYGSRYAKSYDHPIDGSPIPIQVSYTIPANVLYILCTEDLHWDTKGDFDFLRLNGEVWDQAYATRKANFEAPFGGMEQRWAERCDTQIVIQDMRNDI